MIHSGGKLLRPAYQLLFSAYGGDKDRESRRIGGLDRNAPHCLVDPRRYRRSCDTRRKLPTIRSNLATMSLSMLVITSLSAALN